MRLLSFRICLLSIIPFLFACDAAQTSGAGAAGLLTKVSQIGPGDDCAYGGVQFEQGIDANTDNVLTSDEVSQTYVVCNAPDQVGCSVVDNGDGTSTISCADGTTVTVSNGTDGEDGDDGSDGTQGVSGPPGQDGEDGDDGDDGDNGQNGQPGTNGSNGTDGVDGQNGDDGTNGTSGTNGTNGQDGDDGDDGDDGTNGVGGNNGADGNDGTDGTDGADGQPGTNGTNGTDGGNGADGNNGADGDDGDDGEDGSSWYFETQACDASPFNQAQCDTCTDGGVQMRQWLDSNGNFSFDSGEAAETNSQIITTICNGTTGEAGTAGAATLIESTACSGTPFDQASCDACGANGGQQLRTWIDADLNFTYDAASESASATVTTICNGTNGNAGVAILITALDPNSADTLHTNGFIQCPDGGHIIQRGQDTDNDGFLGASEIDDNLRNYPCHGQDAALVVITDLDSNSADALHTDGFSECPQGGYIIQVGDDDNGNGELDGTELDDDIVKYVCHGTPGNAILIAPIMVDCAEPQPFGDCACNSDQDCITMHADAVTTCPDGGSIIRVGQDTNANGTLDPVELADGNNTITTAYNCHGINGTVCSISNPGNGTSTLTCAADTDDETSSSWPSGLYFRDIACGAQYTCALNVEGEPHCWGDSASTAPADTIFNTLSGGPAHVCGIKTNDNVVCWGSGSGVNIPAEVQSDPFAQISSGTNHTCGLKGLGSGSVSCWGDDSSNQSNPDSGLIQNTCSEANPNNLPCDPLPDFKQIAAGGTFSCGITTSNELFCWGSIAGDNANNGSIPAGTFSDIAAGDNHACAIKTSDQTVECWGTNTNGSTTEPATAFTKIAAGGNYNCGIKTDGTVECWGDASSHRDVLSGVTFLNIEVGAAHVCGISNNDDKPTVSWGTDDPSSGKPDDPFWGRYEDDGIF